MQADSFDWRSISAAMERIRPHVHETPLLLSPRLSQATGASVFLKMENRQHTGSFKLRGATNRLLCLTDSARAAGVITASTGNHGLAVAHAASRLGIDAAIFMPESASPRKVAKLRDFPVELRFVSGDAVNAELAARRAAAETGRFFVSPYNDPEIVAGQGTVAVEMLAQQPDLDAVFVAVGGGGLIGGVGSYCKAENEEHGNEEDGFARIQMDSHGLSENVTSGRVEGRIQVVGCLPENSPVMLESVRAGRIVEMESRPTLSDGTAGGIEPGSITFAICRAVVDEWLTVSEEEIAAAMRLVYAESGEVIEGAAGVAVAALHRAGQRFAGRTVGVVICGGNVDEQVFHIGKSHGNDSR